MHPNTKQAPSSDYPPATNEITASTKPDPFAAPSTQHHLTSSTPFTAHISNPFSDSENESGESAQTNNRGFGEDSFDGGFGGDPFVVATQSSAKSKSDITELSGISFSSPPPPVVATPKKVSPDYSHIDYSAFHTSPVNDFASPMPVTDAKATATQSLASPKKATSSLDTDFFQSAAASAFKQFGSATPSKAAFVAPPKKSLAEMTDATVRTLPAQTPDVMVMGGNNMFGGFEKVN